MSLSLSSLLARAPDDSMRFTPLFATPTSWLSPFYATFAALLYIRPPLSFLYSSCLPLLLCMSPRTELVRHLPEQQIGGPFSPLPRCSSATFTSPSPFFYFSLSTAPCATNQWIILSTTSLPLTLTAVCSSRLNLCLLHWFPSVGAYFVMLFPSVHRLSSSPLFGLINGHVYIQMEIIYLQ